MANAALYFGCRRAQQQRHFLDAEHCRYPPRIRHDGEPARQIRPVERHCEKEAQGRDRAVDARRLQSDLRLVQLEETQIFRCRRVGRPADIGCECPDVSHIAAARVLLKPRTVISSIMRARSGLTRRAEVSEVIRAPLSS